MTRTEGSLSDRPGSSVFSALPKLNRPPETGIPRRPDDIPIGDRLAAVVRIIKQTLNCEAVGIRLIDEDGNATYCVQDGFPDEFAAICQSVSLYRDDCLCSRLLRSNSGGGASFYNEQDIFMAGSACEFRSVLLCRVRYMDLNLGLIHCADTRSRRFTQQSAKVIEDFAETIGRSLFFDSLWLPAGWARSGDAAPLRAVCSICGRHRDDAGRWFEERRRKPRISWSVLRMPRIVCPHCLRFSTVE